MCYLFIMIRPLGRKRALNSYKEHRMNSTSAEWYGT